MGQYTFKIIDPLASMERLDETLHDLESSNECGEVERLAEQLLDIITKDKELYSGYLLYVKIREIILINEY